MTRDEIRIRWADPLRFDPYEAERALSDARELERARIVARLRNRASIYSISGSPISAGVLRKAADDLIENGEVGP